jgi:hypothetical protein
VKLSLRLEHTTLLLSSISKPFFLKSIKSKVLTTSKGINHPQINAITSNSKLIHINEGKKINLAQLCTRTDKNFKNELSKGNYEFIIDKIMFLNSKSYDAIYIHVEEKVGNNEYFLSDFIKLVQSYTNLPLVIAANSSYSLDHALRVYKGIAGVKLLEMQEQKKNEMLHIIRKYGSVIFEKDNICEI